MVDGLRQDVYSCTELFLAKLGLGVLPDAWSFE